MSSFVRVALFWKWRMDNEVLCTWLIPENKSTSVLCKRSFGILLLPNNTVVSDVSLGFGNWSGPSLSLFCWGRWIGLNTRPVKDSLPSMAQYGWQTHSYICSQCCDNMSSMAGRLARRKKEVWTDGLSNATNGHVSATKVSLHVKWQRPWFDLDKNWAPTALLWPKHSKHEWINCLISPALFLGGGGEWLWWCYRISLYQEI